MNKRRSLGSRSARVIPGSRVSSALVLSAIIGLPACLLGVILGWAVLVNAVSYVFDFSTASDYVYDANKITVSGGLASLSQVDQTDDDGTATGFGGGTHSGTVFSSGRLQKSVLDTSNADFTSRVINVATTTWWNLVSWVADEPYGKELPNTLGTETAYLSGNADMSGNVYLQHLNEAGGSTSFLDSSGAFVTSTCNGATCPTAGSTGRFNQALSFDGVDDYVSAGDVTSTEGLSAFTAETWFNPAKNPRASAFQPLAEKWSVTSSMATSSFSIFNMASLDARFAGAYASAFDGRYVYLATTADNVNGGITRYDTQGGGLSNAGSYAYFDPTSVVGTSTYLFVTYFDGRYVYMGGSNPTYDRSYLLRFDTQGTFTDPASYVAFDVTSALPSVSFVQGVGFDGRYLYYNSYPTSLLRFDTQASFTDASSYAVFDLTSVSASVPDISRGVIYDGRYVYLVPFGGNVRSGVFIRYDTQASFSSPSSYVTFDTATISAASKGFWGGVFDGRYIYLVPMHNGAYSGQITRYDTQGVFTDSAAYSTFNLFTLNSGALSYIGAVFDGRYVYFVPNRDGNSGRVARYDTLQGFASPSAYAFFELTGVDAGAHGYYDGTFDGRYVYFLPGFDAGSVTHGIMARYDTSGGNASFGLRSMMNSDGLSGSSPGITAVLQTSAGSFSASDDADRQANAWHHAAMTYDGASLKLYVDGALVRTTPASGTISDSTIPLAFGASNGGGSKTFSGSLDELAAYSRALSATEIADHYHRGAERLKFQVRSCTTTACTATPFIGPDGTAATYYSEAGNATTGTPSLTLNVVQNPVLQYKAFLETDALGLSPKLQSISVNPVHYAGDQPTISNVAGTANAIITGFTEEIPTSSQGVVRYQIGKGGAPWYFWNGTDWVVASPNQTNTASDVNTGIAYFPGGTGNLAFQAILISTSGTQPVSLDQVAFQIQPTAEPSNSGGGGGGGGSVPTPQFFLPPTPPFTLKINEGVMVTASPLVTLSISVGSSSIDLPVTDRMALSSDPDFTGANIEPFASTRVWNVCGMPTCPDGHYVVYAKFYTQYGKYSGIITADIELRQNVPAVSEPSVPAVPVNASTTVSDPGVPEAATPTSMRNEIPSWRRRSVTMYVWQLLERQLRNSTTRFNRIFHVW